ncbi:MAG: helix-turn-helix transcriptional regulator, partial [Flavobacteriales bacterium]|nr:helix-turn-helix transcriptional regulator [Flavobacteriales bacterium]
MLPLSVSIRVYPWFSPQRAGELHRTELTHVHRYALRLREAFGVARSVVQTQASPASANPRSRCNRWKRERAGNSARQKNRQHKVVENGIHLSEETRTTMPSSHPYFGPNLKLLRARRGRSQEETAIGLDVKRSSWSGYENGSAEPPLDLLVR